MGTTRVKFCASKRSLLIGTRSAHTIRAGGHAHRPTKAGHMTAPDRFVKPSTSPLHRRGRPHMNLTHVTSKNSSNSSERGSFRYHLASALVSTYGTLIPHCGLPHVGFAADGKGWHTLPQSAMERHATGQLWWKQTRDRFSVPGDYHSPSSVRTSSNLASTARILSNTDLSQPYLPGLCLTI
jgi:hypothetical protein